MNSQDGLFFLLYLIGTGALFSLVCLIEYIYLAWRRRRRHRLHPPIFHRDFRDGPLL